MVNFSCLHISYLAIFIDLYREIVFAISELSRLHIWYLVYIYGKTVVQYCIYSMLKHLIVPVEMATSLKLHRCIFGVLINLPFTYFCVFPHFCSM